MIEVKLSAVIKRPRNEVFDMVANHYVENLPKWNRDIVKFERLDKGPIKVGSRIDEIQSIKGRKMTRIVEVSAYEENKLFSVKNVPQDPPKEKYSTVYAFEEVTEGTKLTQVSKFEMYNWFFKIFGPIFLNKIIIKDVTRNFNELVVPFLNRK